MKFKGNLNTLRNFLYAGPTLYLLWGVAGQFTRPDTYDPLWQRGVLWAIVLGFTLSSHFHDWTKKNFNTIFYALAYLFTAHYFFIVYKNSLGPTFIIGCIMMQMAVSLTFMEPKGLLWYSLFVAAVATPTMLIETVYPKAYLGLGVFTITTMMWFTMEGKRRLVSKMRSQRYFVEMQNAELAALNEEIEVRQERFHTLVEAVVSATGEDLYISLTKALSDLLEADYAFVGELSSDGERVSTIAFASGDKLLKPFSYIVKASPCEVVFKEGYATYKKGVAALFPEDTDLVERDIESYSGSRITDSEGKPMGILVIMSKAPMQDEEFNERVMKIFATRAGSEMERQKSESLILKQQLQMVESARLASLGEMAGGIAHEINNPLAIIQGFASIVKLSAERGELDLEKTSESMERIGETCNRIGKIIKGLRVVARDGEGEPFDVHRLSDIVEDTLSLCFEKAKSLGIKISFQGVHKDLKLKCRRVQVGQVLTNMINNSLHAVENLEQKWIEVEVSEDRKTGQAVLLVTDSGRGIPDEIQEKLMRPFFTTKSIGEGTGLGLSVSLGIMKDHNGSLELNNYHPHTQFILRFGSPWIRANISDKAS